MVGIILITHGTLGESLIQCATHVLSSHPLRVLHVAVNRDEAPEQVQARALDCIRQVDAGRGVLLLTDMLGATPSNIATRLLAPGRIEAVAGVSLPMLIRAITYREQPLATVVRKAVSGGTDGVVHIQTERIHAAG